MMDDLISRQAAVDALSMMQGIVAENGVRKGISMAWQQIEDLPSAQPEPHEGHWIWVVGDLECSKCHTRYPDLYPDYDNSVACPHCGARMKGEQNETD